MVDSQADGASKLWKTFANLISIAENSKKLEYRPSLKSEFVSRRRKKGLNSSLDSMLNESKCS
jgi:hypothetical protein